MKPATHSIFGFQSSGAFGSAVFWAKLENGAGRLVQPNQDLTKRNNATQK